MINLDPRIGALNSGVFYAFVNGYDQPEVRGTRYEVEIALGLRRKPAERKTYTVTMTQGSDVAETEHTGTTAAEAITKARDFWNMQEGRTRSCGMLPRKFRAKVK